jgi:dihydropyrimidinase
MSLGIVNGTIVTAVDRYTGDVRIEDGRIVAIGAGVADNCDDRVDAKGLLVLPGGIDAHTHFDLPFGGTVSADDFETGTRAAAFGGTTTCIDFAVQYKGESLREGIDNWHARAEGKATSDYAFHMIMGDVTSGSLEEMRRVVDEGITSFKLFMAYPGVFLSSDGEIFQALQRAADLGALIQMHAENGSVIDVLVQQALDKGQTAPIYHALTRPSIAEGEATRRAIALAEIAGAPIYIVHMTASEATDAVSEARARGLSVFGETCPQYLFLNQEHYNEPDFGGAKYVMSPPLRPRQHGERLWRALQTDQLSVVATDHCPFCMKEQKELGKDNFAKIPNGAPGVENRMQLLYHGGVAEKRFDIHRFVDITATAPAKIFGLFPRKGTIAPGSDADLVLFDPESEFTISVETQHMNCDYSAYEGMKVQGRIMKVFSRGEMIVDGDAWLGRAGRGQFVRCGSLGTSA